MDPFLPTISLQTPTTVKPEAKQPRNSISYSGDSPNLWVLSTIGYFFTMLLHQWLLPLSIFLGLILARVFYVVYRSGKRLCKNLQPLSTLIIMGSGGHTAEMLNLLAVLNIQRFEPRFYIAAATDNMSLQKARSFEDSLTDEGERNCQYMQIYRSREVGQSYITSIVTTLTATAHALWLMIKIRPQVILCNGPGTCIPLCVIAFFFKVVGIRWSFVFYMESIARVRRLSLSGLLLYKLRMADQFFVQWPQLKREYPRSHYVGCLM